MTLTDWHGLYGESWQNEIVPEAFSHPAKFSRALIRHIYAHMFEEGWLEPGMSVVDPFGGVALGALDAMRRGLNWTGVELEMRFVGLGNVNIINWMSRYAPHFPGWGTARLLQGDSRELAKVIGEAGGGGGVCDQSAVCGWLRPHRRRRPQPRTHPGRRAAWRGHQWGDKQPTVRGRPGASIHRLGEQG